MTTIFNKFFKTSLKSKVMKKIEAHIANTQKNFDLEVKHLSESNANKITRIYDTALAEIKETKREYIAKKSELEERHVSNLLAKFL